MKKSIYNCETYACYAKKQEVLSRSTSGGVFFVLAQHIIQHGGVVYGVLSDENMNVFHKGIQNVKQLEKLQGSKYVQSRIGDAYKKVKNNLVCGKIVLFSGTPCQIAGLNCYLKRLCIDMSKLYTVNVLCAGVPSNHLYKQYIEEITSKKGTVKEITFRDQRFGWDRVFISIKTDIGEYTADEQKDPFGYGFSHGFILRRSCNNCLFRGINSGADISIGDYWGIQSIHPNFYNPNGNSLVIIRSQKGERLFSSCRNNLVICKSSILDAMKYSSVIEEPLFEIKQCQEDNYLRQLFFENYIENNSFIESISIVSNYINNNRIRIKMWGSYSLKMCIRSGCLVSGTSYIANQSLASGIMSVMNPYLPRKCLSNQNSFREKMVKKDLYGLFFESDEVYSEDDYFIFDLLEERYPILVSTNQAGGYITKSDFFLSCDNHNEMLSYPEVSLSEQNIDLWKQCFDKWIDTVFFHFKKNHIVMVEQYLATQFGSYTAEETFIDWETIETINKRLSECYSYIKKQYSEIVFIISSRNNYSFIHNIYGCKPEYYNREYYKDISLKLLKLTGAS